MSFDRSCPWPRRQSQGIHGSDGAPAAHYPTGLFGSEKLLDYSMTKGGIHPFTKALASNLVARGIRVNAVAPGPVWTPLNPADQPADKVAEFGKSSLMGRPAQPEEIAPAYVFLASPSCSSYISGAVLPVMGGRPTDVHPTLMERKRRVTLILC